MVNNVFQRLFFVDSVGYREWGSLRLLFVDSEGGDKWYFKTTLWAMENYVCLRPLFVDSKGEGKWLFLTSLFVDS